MSEYSSNLLEVLRRTLDEEIFPPEQRRDLPRQHFWQAHTTAPERHVSPPNLDYPSFPPRAPEPRNYNLSPYGSERGDDSRSEVNYVEIRPRARNYNSSPYSSERGDYSTSEVNYVETRPARGRVSNSSPYGSQRGGYSTSEVDYVEIRPRFGYDTMPQYDYQHPDAPPLRPGPPLGRQPALRPLPPSFSRYRPISPVYEYSSSSLASSLSSFTDGEVEFNEFERSRRRSTGHGGFETLPPEFDYEPPRTTRHEGSRTVATLLAALPRVEVSTLPEDDKSCPICTNKYNTASEATSTDASVTESCVRLLCHHTIGKNCIKRWLEEGNTTCPICRTDVYSP